jgi:hypothetical protein
VVEEGRTLFRDSAAVGENDLYPAFITVLLPAALVLRQTGWERLITLYRAASGEFSSR